MENLQETINRLERLVKSPSTMSAEDRSFVREIAPEFGVEIRNTRCKDCYVDAATLCLIEARKRIAPEQKPEEDKRKYILKAGTDVYFGSVRVNEATITDELASRLIERGFERKFFVKCE